MEAPSAFFYFVRSFQIIDEYFALLTEERFLLKNKTKKKTDNSTLKYQVDRHFSLISIDRDGIDCVFFFLLSNFAASESHRTN